jgi:hypothetical protein
MPGALERGGGPIPKPPGLRPNWTTWMWLSFAVLVVVATFVGIYYSSLTSWY